MDPLSQAVVGAALPASVSKVKHMKFAALCGALGGLAPDLDIVIRSSTDPLLAIEYHRHFTHSLFFVPFGGFIVAILLWLLFFRRNHPFLRIYTYATLGLATHGLLDAFTSYGTRLFWPVSNVRITWSYISIIDPLFTFPLVIFLKVALAKKSQNIIRYGGMIALCYLGFGAFKHHQIIAHMEKVADSRGHQIERIFLNPTIANNTLWRSVYKSGDQYYIDAVHNFLFSPKLIAQGTSTAFVDKETVFPSLPKDSKQREDIRRFAYFSKDFIYMHQQSPNVIADLRYGTLPDNLQSLWGIKVTPEQPDTHARFVNLRNFKKRDYQRYLNMLFGRPTDDSSVSEKK